MQERQRLLSKKQEIEDLIKRKQEFLEMSLSEYSDELSLYDQHPADVATDVYEREKEQSFLELLSFELEKVEDALNQYQAGRYGICEMCGNAIEPARLQVLESTTLCSACAHQNENQPGAVPGEILNNHGTRGNRGEDLQIAGYDFYE